MHVSTPAEREAFITADGSEIREYAGRVSAPTANQSLAEARVAPGRATADHFHPVAEELYLITAGRGRLRVDGEERDLAPGDCAVIPPGAHHKIWNTGEETLVFLCCCAPPYHHDDTVLLEDPAGA